MQLYGIPNLSSHTATLSSPWDFEGTINPEFKGNKELRTKWITDAKTQHNCYSAYEGLTPSQRITKDNPAYFMRALIADFDSHVSENEVKAGIARCGGCPPTYVEFTLSGNCRFVWLLEKPFPLPTRQLTIHFLKNLKKLLRIGKIMPGLDDKAWEDPSTTFTNSCNWLHVGDHAIKDSLMHGWMLEALRSYNWNTDETSKETNIPMEKVRAEIEKHWPGRWTGDFAVGKRGVNFWNPDSDNTSAAYVTPNGIYSFTDPIPFRSWDDLFGSHFTREYRVDKMGSAITDVYFDGQNYYYPDGRGDWKDNGREDMRLFLKVQKDLSSTPVKGQPSEVDFALSHVQIHQRVDGAGPMLFYPKGVVEYNGRRILNTFNRRAMAPSNEPTHWGKDGDFPWLSEFLDVFFASDHEKLIFLAWLQTFYKSAVELKPQLGQVLFIAGAVNTGKTLLANVILSKLVGGFADVQSYIVEGGSFSGHVYEVPLLTLNDSTPTADHQKHARYSALVKRFGANQDFEYHCKFKMPCMVPWRGRLVITLNDDAESSRILPETEISILDKIILLKSSDPKVKPRNFLPTPEQQIDVLNRELPKFARWLLDMKMPEECNGSTRYQVKSYHNQELLETARQSSPSNSFIEILNMWLPSVTTNCEPQKDKWEGSGTSLLAALLSYPGISALARNYTPVTIGRSLQKLVQLGYNISSKRTAASNTWTIPAKLTCLGEDI